MLCPMQAVASRFAALLLLAVWTETLGYRQMKKKKQPNVIFMFADDLGFDLGCYGHPYARTPNLDKLAAEGTIFKNFHVTGVTCTPSRTGFMTGRQPASYPNYMADFGFQGVPTITRLLHDAGYAVGHFGKWHIGPDEDDGAYGIDSIEIIGGKQRDPRGRDAMLYEAAMHFIEEQVGKDPDKPFYANIWGHISHSPVVPPESMVKLFEDVRVDYEDFGRHMQQRMDKLQMGENKTLDRLMQEYLAEVWSVDLMVGKLCDLLDRLGIRNDTIIAFSSDHGPTPEYVGYAGGFRGGKHEFYEGGVRVPFILSWPDEGGIPQNNVNEESLLFALDWTPTLCRIIGLPCDTELFEGEDVSDIWLGLSDRSRVAPLVWSVSNVGSRLAMLYGKWKLHSDSRGRSLELYDLKANPEEDENVYSQNEAIGDAMSAKLMEWDGTLPGEYCKEKDGCTTALPFDRKALPITACPPVKLYLDQKHGEKPEGRTLFFEGFEKKKRRKPKRAKSVRRIPAQKLPAGAMGSFVGNTTVPAFPKWRNARYKMNIPVARLSTLQVRALVGLAAKAKGSIRFRILIEFDKGAAVTSYASTIGPCQHEILAEYDRAVEIPPGARSIRSVKLQLRNSSPGKPKQIVFVDNISVSAVEENAGLTRGAVRAINFETVTTKEKGGNVFRHRPTTSNEK